MEQTCGQEQCISRKNNFNLCNMPNYHVKGLYEHTETYLENNYVNAMTAILLQK